MFSVCPYLEMTENSGFDGAPGFLLYPSREALDFNSVSIHIF